MRNSSHVRRGCFERDAKGVVGVIGCRVEPFRTCSAVSQLHQVHVKFRNLSGTFYLMVRVMPVGKGYGYDYGCGYIYGYGYGYGNGYGYGQG